MTSSKMILLPKGNNKMAEKNTQRSEHIEHIVEY